MKIAIDIRCLIEGQRTGVGEYAWQVLENIFLQDRENEYILFMNGYHELVVDLSWTKRYPNVKVKRFRWPNKLLNFCLWYFRWPKLDRLVGGADIFFMPNLNFAAFSSDVKVFVTAHDLSFERYPETFSWKRRLWHAFVNFRQLCRRADTIIAVSESTRYDLKDLYRVPEYKITVVHSGISDRFRMIDRNSPQLMAVKEKYRLPYRFILYLGTLEPRKNVSALVRAYEQLQRSGHPELRPYALVIAGAEGWKCRDVLREIDRSEFRSNIILTGFVEDEDKSALYNLSSLFVYPSFLEGFGFPPVEAMRCSVPIITSHTSSFPEVIGDAGVMIDPYQPEEIYLAMKEVLLNKDLRERLSQKGFERSKNFTWYKTAKELLRLWRV